LTSCSASRSSSTPTPPGPEIPAEVVDGTRARYVEAYEQLSGESFDEYLAKMGVV